MWIRPQFAIRTVLALTFFVCMVLAILNQEGPAIVRILLVVMLSNFALVVLVAGVSIYIHRIRNLNE